MAKTPEKAEKKLTVAQRAQLKLVSVKLRLTGASALLMNSNRSIDEFDQEKRELTKLTSETASTRSSEKEDAIAYLDWSLRLYYDVKLGPYLPSHNIRKSIIQAARKYSKGKTLEQAMIYQKDKCKLVYDGPRTKEALWASGEYVDARPVRNSGMNKGTVMRRRPKFDQWSVDVEFLCDSEEVDVENVPHYAIIAGNLLGVGDYRPDCGGVYGRYTVKVL